MRIKANKILKCVGEKIQLITCIEKVLPENFTGIKNVTYIKTFVDREVILILILKKYLNIIKSVINEINPDIKITLRSQSKLVS